MILKKVKEVIAEQLNIQESEVSEDTSFQDDLGADSLDIFQIIMALEEEFDIEISNEDAEKINTVKDAVEYIKNTASGE
ncbi:MAG: acyl carrier protein [Epulopiscium sp.]|nr:acyl carrier protein [Candidatus Epulonipiscium sp.]